jgi:amino acid adenylation domain-containing protein
MAMSLAEALTASIQRHSAAVAVVQGSRSYTYAQLGQVSAAMAGGLRGRGVRPGDVVAIRSTRSWLRCAAVLAAWRAGVGVLSLDPAMPQVRAQKVLSDAGCVLVIGEPAAGAADVPFISFAEAVGTSVAEVVDGPVAYVIPTSGSTGEPKSVAVPPVVLAELGAWQVRQWEHAAPPHTLHAASIGFDVGYQELVATWLSGAALVVVDDDQRRDPFALVPLVREHAVARLFLPVAMLHSLAMAALFDDVPLESLREIAVAGEQLVVNDEVREFCARDGVALLNQYGPSETHVVTQHRLPGDPAGWPDRPPIGSAAVNAELLRWEGGRLRPFQDGETGELVIAGDCVGLGYLGDPELTARKFRVLPHQDGRTPRCYFSGDLVRRDGAGYQFLSRVDDQLKVGGYRVEPGEVEAAVSGVKGVRRCSVIGMDRLGTVALAAFYVLEEGSPMQAAQLAEECGRLLPSYMVPASFIEVRRIPLTPNGKIDRRALESLLDSAAGTAEPEELADRPV